MNIGLRVKYPLFKSHFNELRIFSTDFRKILQYKISLKSVLREVSCSIQMDGQRDMTKLMVAFRNFAKAPKNCSSSDTTVSDTNTGSNKVKPCIVLSDTPTNTQSIFIK
jgi:hypothetical protein